MGILTNKRCSKVFQKNPYSKNGNGTIRGFDANPSNVQKSSTGKFLKIFAYPYGYMTIDLQDSNFIISQNTLSSLRDRVNISGYNSYKVLRDVRNITSIMFFKVDKRQSSFYLCGTGLADFNVIQKSSSSFVNYFTLRGNGYETINNNLVYMNENNIQVKKNIGVSKGFQSQFDFNGRLQFSEPSSLNNKLQVQSPRTLDAKYAAPAYAVFDVASRPYYARSIDFPSYSLVQNCKYEGKQINFRNPI